MFRPAVPAVALPLLCAALLSGCGGSVVAPAASRGGIAEVVAPAVASQPPKAGPGFGNPTPQAQIAQVGPPGPGATTALGPQRGTGGAPAVTVPQFTPRPGTVPAASPAARVAAPMAPAGSAAVAGAAAALTPVAGTLLATGPSLGSRHG